LVVTLAGAGFGDLAQFIAQVDVRQVACSEYRSTNEQAATVTLQKAFSAVEYHGRESGWGLVYGGRVRLAGTAWGPCGGGIDYFGRVGLVGNSAAIDFRWVRAKP
jgi:hypothetical protein